MDTVKLFFRWLHVIAGIAWIGHLYFFNFVNIQLQKDLGDNAPLVNPHLMPRALFWFRWGAMITFLAGLVLYFLHYLYIPGVGPGFNDAARSSKHGWILMGMAFGTVMWFNVWFVIWPAQKSILSKQATGDVAAALKAKAAFASRINTYSSGPMLFGMLGAQHFEGGNPGAVMALCVLIGLAVIWGAYAHAPKVGLEFKKPA